MQHIHMGSMWGHVAPQQPIEAASITRGGRGREGGKVREGGVPSPGGREGEREGIPC